VLLYEIQALYVKLLGAVVAQRRERDARLMTGDAVAAALAHEIRQPLTAMMTSADAGLNFLRRRTPDLAGANQAFTRIVADGHRAGSVIESVRAVFRKDVANRTALDVNEVIHQALQLARNDLMKHNIRVEVQRAERLPDVRGNAVQLQQVILNLITNASDSMAAAEQPRILRVKSQLHNGGEVLISVADTGRGIGAQDADRIFNPLFTTKAHGMGLGLSICRSIVEAHEGQLWVEPNAPQGAVFQFTLRTGN
jgi:C4-dicarboxylate-specific signal transduction histidine kinase